MNQLSGSAAAEPNVLHAKPVEEPVHADGLVELGKCKRYGHEVFSRLYEAENKPYENSDIHDRYLSGNPAAKYKEGKNNLRMFKRMRALNQAVDAKGIDPSDTAAVMAEAEIVCATYPH